MSSLKFDNILNIYNNDNIDEKINNFLISIDDIDNLYLQLQLHKTIIDMKNELNNIHLRINILYFNFTGRGSARLAISGLGNFFV